MIIWKNFSTPLVRTYNMFEMKRNELLLLFSIAFLLMFSCSQDKEKQNAGKQQYCLSSELKKNLELTTVAFQPIEQSITLTGEVEGNSDKTVPYVSLVDGIVSEIFFSLGDYVRKGQVLATVRSTTLNEIQDDTKSLSAQLEVAKRKLKAVESMYKDDIASQKDLQEAKAEVQILQSNLEKNRKNLQLYSGNQTNFVIKAPADGYIIEKNISSGMPVTAGGEKLFTVSNLEKVWVMANVYATDMRKVYVGQQASVKTLAYPDETFGGNVNAISQIFNEDERVLKAKIIMNNHDMKLRPGMSADITLPIKSSTQNALAIPKKALIFDNNQSYVLVYENDCDIEIRPVTETASNDALVYVNDGIKEGEKIIVTNGLLIYENLKSQSR